MIFWTPVIKFGLSRYKPMKRIPGVMLAGALALLSACSSSWCPLEDGTLGYKPRSFYISRAELRVHGSFPTVNLSLFSKPHVSRRANLRIAVDKDQVEVEWTHIKDPKRLLEMKNPIPEEIVRVSMKKDGRVVGHAHHHVDTWYHWNPDKKPGFTNNSSSSKPSPLPAAAGN